MNAIQRMGLAAVVLVTACAGEAEEDVALEEPVAEHPAASGSAAQPVQASAGAVLQVDTLEGAGPYLTDGSGRALYLLEADPQGESTCVDACAQVWPPYLAAQGAPTAGEPALQAGLIGTLQRTDGSTQVTYGGHALYHYTRDQGPGQTTGQDVHDEWGEWYLVTPQGQPLEEHGEGRS